MSRRTCFIILALATLIVRLPFFLPENDLDESTFILLGQDILKGHLPYVTLWDLKPPLLYVFFCGCPVRGKIDSGGSSGWIVMRYRGRLVRMSYRRKGQEPENGTDGRPASHRVRCPYERYRRRKVSTKITYWTFAAAGVFCSISGAGKLQSQEDVAQA